MQDNCQNKRSFITFLVTAFAALWLAGAPVSLAQDSKTAQPPVPVQPTKQAPPSEMSPEEKLEILNKQLRSIAAALLSDLGSNELQVIYDIRQNYGVVQGVRNVRDDVARGVESCLDKNPDMTALKTSFENWKDDLYPLVKEADQKVMAAIENQKIVDPDKFKTYLATIDLIVKIQDNKFQKAYISDRESCKNLKTRLNDTKEGLLQLLDKAFKEM